jgi:ATP-binding cassette subfamily C protein CydC
MSSIRTFLPLFSRQMGWMALALLLSLMAVGAGIGLLGSSGWFLTAAALSTAGAAFNIFGPSAAVRGFSFLRILARYFEKMAGHDGTLRLLSNLRGWLFARLFPLVPLNDRDSRHGDLVSRLTADVDALDTVFLVTIGPILSSVVVGPLACCCPVSPGATGWRSPRLSRWSPRGCLRPQGEPARGWSRKPRRCGLRRSTPWMAMPI